MQKKSILLSLTAIPFLAACGGGGSGSSTVQTSQIVGTVPGTKIEAFCDNDIYKVTQSVQNETDKHPFTLEIPKNTNCRLIMTTNEDDPLNKVITALKFDDQKGNQSIIIKVEGDEVDLGYIDLPMSINEIDDIDGDHVKDTPLVTPLSSSDAQIVLDENDPLDTDGDGIIDMYEDDDHDHIPNIDDDDYGQDNDDDNDDDDDNNDDDNDTTPPVDTNTTGDYMLTAWNDLGMHCMDGNDFSVFSVLPPYNNLHAQIKDKNGDLITTGITITYESTQGTDGKINTTSLKTTDGTEKTNFWDYATDLFGATLQPDVGLTGNPMSSTTPAPMTFNTVHQWWEAEGIPISPYNDDGTKNYYPLVKVVAKDSTGKILAEVKTVLPVSDEMDCKRCHASTSATNDAKPNAGWVNNADLEKDYKYNILRLHDESEPDAVSKNLTDLEAKGYNYDSKGLEATALGGTPVLCVACHKSNALPGVGLELKAFTEAIHSKHADVTDPISGMKLGDSNNRSSCYACHPGAQTECLRGAMGDAKNPDGSSQMQCQSCHGTMHAVGDKNREGWFDEPNCQACHHDGKQETSAIDPATNTLRHVIDTRFATNIDTPVAGVSLYRFSTGHGDLQCEACHGATHAIYPAHNADNLLSEGVQGHSGTIGECTACHTTTPKTTNKGPHGMHSVGQSWIGDHEDVAENDPAQCKACHGQDYRGSALSKTWTSRSFSVEGNQKNFPKGHQVSCYDCHNGPNGD
jgi:hypothetical protein